LPFDGGLLDQPEWLLEDLLTISWIKSHLEEQVKPPPASTLPGQIRSNIREEDTTLPNS